MTSNFDRDAIDVEEGMSERKQDDWEGHIRMKRHLKRIVSNVKLTLEEFPTVIAQVESVLNSHPLAPLPTQDDVMPWNPLHQDTSS